MTNPALIQHKRYTAMHLPKTLGDVVSNEFTALTAKVLEGQKHVVLSCAGVQSIPPAWLGAIRFLARQLKASSKLLRLVFVEEPARTEIASPSADFQLVMSESLASALNEFSAGNAQTQRMHYLRAFVAATMRTLFVQTGIQCKQGRIHYLEVETNERLLGDISGIIIVETYDYTYAVIVSFPKETFLGVISRFLNEVYTEITPDIQDGATEILNIIFGQAKVLLNKTDATLQPSIPVLTLGRVIKPTNDKFEKAEELLFGGKTVVVPFETEVGTFFIEIAFPADISSRMLAG